MNVRPPIGVCPPALTMFDEGGALDLKATCRHIDWLISQGVNGIVSGGTVGEFFSLDYEERVALAQTVVEHVDGRIAVYVGVSDSMTGRAIRLAQNAEKAGATGVMSLPPYFGSMTGAEVRRYFERMNEATSLPFVLYNNPGAVANVALSVPTIAELANDGLVSIVKDTQGDPARIHELKASVPEDVAVLYGEDYGAFEGIFAGADGWTAGVANFMPGDCVSLWKLMQDGDYEAARDVWSRIMQLIRMTSDKESYGRGTERPDYIQIYKAALDLLPDTFGGPVREPLLPLPDADRDILRNELRIAGIL
jgi:dihydrodipicolinate synthase/N-acetylneuraminate lyase